MYEYIIELENGKCDFVWCDCLAEAEAIAIEKYDFNWLDVKREK